MFVVIVDISVKPGFEARFKEAVLRQGQTSMSAEEGCLRFDVLQAPGEPGRFTLCEAYPDEATFENVHRKTPHFAEYAETTRPWVESKSARTFERLWPE
ncbi:MAG: antibiotic biosynthesis monooxygenase [Spirochaetes bacterium]|nr:antibiotic biosynthesis monooxygenase [Spirochaetota bacterium]MBU1079820.1 antibiotic biosynthesis monooxygenase [Spirochaetota bacterium]